MTNHIWQPDEIFVFGSNLKGIHGAGAAKFALDNCGAQLGIGEGMCGQSYALPTCVFPGQPSTLDWIGKAADVFRMYTWNHPEQKFFLTAVGTGIAGFTHDQIAPLFVGLPSWVRVPLEWIEYLNPTSFRKIE